MTWVKICGITNLEDAKVAVEAGADALGFVFYEKSPRYVDSQMVREIVNQLPSPLEKVGLFVDETAENVARIAEEAGVTGVQLHTCGNHSPEKQITPKKVFLALSGPSATSVAGDKAVDWRLQLCLLENLAAILLDSAEIGGTGETFDWEAARAFVASVGQQYPVVVAGGLTPVNVTEAMGILKPWGVDVASGVEARPGKKDPEKVRAFIAAVRDADRRGTCRDSSQRSE